MRKTPLQQRSRDMVATLLRAAAQEIGARGLDATTTNHIAARAGVSIGSLYQYYASKDALVEALLQQHAARLLAAVDVRARSLRDADARSITRGILDAVFDVVESDAAQRELARHWQRLRSGTTFQALEQRMIEHCRLYLLHHHERYHVANLPAALFVTINAVHYTIAHYLSLDAPLLTRREVIDALADMLAAYLSAGERKPNRSQPRQMTTQNKRARTARQKP